MKQTPEQIAEHAAWFKRHTEAADDAARRRFALYEADEAATLEPITDDWGNA